MRARRAVPRAGGGGRGATGGARHWRALRRRANEAKQSAKVREERGEEASGVPAGSADLGSECWPSLPSPSPENGFAQSRRFPGFRLPGLGSP